MKKLLLILLAVSGFTLTSSAQVERKMKPQKSAHEKHMMMMKELNLTDAQKAALKTQHENFKKQLDELDKNEGITLKEYRDKKYALKKEQKAKMLELLTPEQKAKMEQLKKDKEAEHELKQAQNLEKMKTRLGLTDDQVAKIKADSKARHEKMMALKEDESLGRVEKKQQLDALKEQNKEGIKKYLTPEQLKKFEDAQKAKMEKMNKIGKPGKKPAPENQ